MKILLIEPYHTGSHAAWTDGFIANSRHEVELLALEGRFWKWRMHGGAVTLARMFMEGVYEPDLLLATDMLDLTTFLALTRRRTSRTPVAAYFHENQLTYPWSPADRDLARGRDRHYGFLNFTTALAADRVFFNSGYHMDEFLAELAVYLKAFPDYREHGSVEGIRARSSVLYPGMDFSGPAGERPEEEKAERGGPPLVLWNHRWEHDKNPEEFFSALYRLTDKGLAFEVAVLGENFSQAPAVFEEAKKRLAERVVHWGYAEDRAGYSGWLKRADVLPVTSIHDFFGCSVVEAIAAGVYPILPERLAYPEHLPEELHERHLYKDFEGLVEKLEGAITNIDETRRTDLSAYVKRYGWDLMAPQYDSEMERVAGKREVP